ncbi:MAG: PaaI family thioesterase [Alkalispirochaeta sp.]
MSDDAKRVPNPYVGHEGYHCFGCDPHNFAGLQLSFTKEGETLQSSWEPRPEHEGYPGVIHGGIQATLADEIGGWLIHVVKGTAGMTRDLQISYHHPARAADGPFQISARVVEETRKDVLIEVTIHGADGRHFSTARCTYAVFTPEVARRRLHFPGAEAFQPEQ